MKPTLLFALLTLVFAVPKATAATELETLRAKCIEQERQIRRLEEQLAQHKPASPAAAKNSVVSSVPAKSTAAEGAVYKVRSGDCLEKIARKTGCSPSKLAKANGIQVSAMLHPGQTLKLPATAVAHTETPREKPVAFAKESSSPGAGSSYTIKQGETYSSISRKTRVPVDTLIAANPSIKPTALRPGLVIRLSPASSPTPQPKTTASVAKSPLTTQTMLASTSVKHAGKPEPKPAPDHHAEKPAVSSHPAIPTPVAETTPAPAPAAAEPKASASSQEAQASPSNTEKKIRSVTIEGEMTYGEFASKHGTDTNRLNDLNGLDLTQTTVLAKGSELYVPAQP